MRFTYSPKSKKQFKKLDSTIQKRIKKFTDELQTIENPRSKGYGLVWGI